jgi:hypothetical protein
MSVIYVNENAHSIRDIALSTIGGIKLIDFWKQRKNTWHGVKKNALEARLHNANSMEHFRTEIDSKHGQPTSWSSESGDDKYSRHLECSVR